MLVSLARRGPRSVLSLAVIATACAAAFAAIPSSTVAAASACSTTASSASGVVSSFCFQPAATDAGSAQTLNTAINFKYAQAGDTVTGITVTLAPGLLAIPNAPPDYCDATDLASGSCPAGSQVGGGTVKADGLPAVAALYAMHGNDIADFGLDIWLGSSQPSSGTNPLATANAAATIGADAAGQPVVQFSFAGLPTSVKLLGLPFPLSVSQLTLSIDGTLGSGATSAAYTRLPTNCSTAISQLTVYTKDSPLTPSGAPATDGGGGDSFTPTNCNKLTFAPQVSATAVRDASDLGVQFVSTITQGANQAAAKSITLNVPPATLGPNLIAAAGSFGDVVGSATAVTPLLSAPLNGTVTLTGSVTAPTLTITIPPPVALTLVGSVDIAGNSVTFAALPDVPLSSLAVTLNGGANGLYETNCTQPTGDLVGVFTGQNGASVTQGTSFTVANCGSVEPVITSPVIQPTTTSTPTTSTTTPTSASGKATPPKLSKGSLAGLATGNAKLGFTLTAGSSKLSSFSVSLPSGLKFDSKTYKQGLSLSGARASKVALSRGRLTVTLRSATAKVAVKLSAKAIDEVSALRTKVKAKKVHTLTSTVVARSAAGASTTLELKLKV